MKSLLLSFYDKHNAAREIDGVFINELSIDDETEIVTVHYSNNTSQELGVARAQNARSVVDAEIINHELVLIFDNSDTLAIGRVDPTVTKTIPTVTGEGLLIDSSTGQYKPLKSDDPAITITKSGTEVTIDIQLDEGQIVIPETDNTINMHLAATLSDNITSGTAGLHGRAGAVGWNTRTFNDLQILSGVNVSYNAGVLTLGRGTWYLDGMHTSSRAGIGKAAVRNSSNQIVLESVNKTHTAADDTLITYIVQGYITVTAATETFTIVQHCTLNAAGREMGVTYLGGEFGGVRPVTQYNIYFVSDIPEALDVTFTAPQKPAFLQLMDQMVTNYGARVPTPVKMFDEILYDDDASWNFSGSCTVGNSVYFGVTDSRNIVEWNTLTNKKTYYKATPPSGTYFSHCLIAAGDEIYIIPNLGVWVGIFNTVTKVLTWTNFGLTISAADNKMVCGAYDPIRQKIFVLPLANVGVMVIDVVAKTAVVNTYGLSYLSAGNYFGAAYADGKVYGIPLEATNILVIDTVANTATQQTMGASLAGASKWCGATYDPVTNKIVGTPHFATDALVIDVATQTATRNAFGLTLTGAVSKFEFSGSTIDGKVYMFPRLRANGQAICIDLVAGTGREITIPWRDGMTYVKSAACNGKVYLLPAGSQRFAMYDPAVDGVVPQDPDRTLVAPGSSSANRFWGSKVSLDGTVYPIPASAGEIYAFNVERDFCNRMPYPLDIVNTANSYYGGVLQENGDVIFTPYFNSDGLKIIPPHPTLGTRRKKHMKDHISLVPILSGPTGLGVTVSASSNQAGMEGWRAFDGFTGNGGTGWAPVNGDPRLTEPWLQVQFSVPTKVEVVRFMAWTSTVSANAVWVAIQVSNDGVEFSEMVRYKPNLKFTYQMSRDIVLPDPAEYMYYRLVILETVGAVATGICRFDLLQINPSEPDYYEVHANQNAATSTMLDITASSNVHASNYNRINVLRDDIYGDVVVGSSWISGNTAGPHTLEFRSRFPIKATAIRLVNGWDYYTTSIRVEGSKNGREYVQLIETVVPNDYATEGQRLRFKARPIITFANTQEYYSYRVTFLTRTVTNGQFSASILHCKLLSAEEYDPYNYMGRPERMGAIYAQGTAAKWRNGILASENGKIYFGKGENATMEFGVYDPAKDEFTTTRLRAPIAQAATELYTTPRKSPFDEAYYFTTSRGLKLLKMEIDENGNEKIGFIPMFKDYTSDGDSTTYPALGPDGCCYALARAAPLTIHVFDTEYQSYYTEYYDGVSPGGVNYVGSGLGPNGKLYFPPYIGNQIVEVDTVNMSSRSFAHLVTLADVHLLNATLTKSGKLYLEAIRGGTGFNGFFFLDFGPGITIPDEILYSPYLNN